MSCTAYRVVVVEVADLDRWAYLQSGITRIMNDLEQGIDMQMYMGVYT